MKTLKVKTRKNFFQFIFNTNGLEREIVLEYEQVGALDAAISVLQKSGAFKKDPMIEQEFTIDVARLEKELKKFENILRTQAGYPNDEPNGEEHEEKNTGHFL